MDLGCTTFQAMHVKCWDLYWKDWYIHPESSLKDTTGPTQEMIGKNLHEWFVVDLDMMTKPETKSHGDFNKTWMQYAIGFRPVVLHLPVRML